MSLSSRRLRRTLPDPPGWGTTREGRVFNLTALRIKVFSISKGRLQGEACSCESRSSALNKLIHCCFVFGAATVGSAPKPRERVALTGPRQFDPVPLARQGWKRGAHVRFSQCPSSRLWLQERHRIGGQWPEDPLPSQDSLNTLNSGL